MAAEPGAMNSLPLISIVTPSFNQGRFIGETLQSLVAQEYPSLEVIIQDGGSTDDSIAIAKSYAESYPGIFRLFVEQDRGQAHALNLGFAKARGEILGFLNSDDTLLPGCLHAVARQIDPGRGRLIVFGRSLFTGEDSPYAGVEHPARYTGHFDQLAIWQRGFNTIPQPSTFWHRQVWEICGGFDEGETHVLDYDLFCRFSGRFEFHFVDALWSTYRMHTLSKSAQRTEAEVLEMSIAASRRHWPGWWHPLRWRLAFSHWMHDRHLHERARHHARRAEEAFATRQPLRGVGEVLQTFWLSPGMAWVRLLQPVFTSAAFSTVKSLVWEPDPETEFAGRYADGWIGPRYREEVEISSGARRLRVQLEHRPQARAYRKITAELYLDGQLAQRKKLNAAGAFELQADVERFRGRTCTVELRVRPYFVPSTIAQSGDHRKLTVMFDGIAVE